MSPAQATGSGTRAVLLASTSPRRAALMRDAGFELQALDPGIDDRAEDVVAGHARGDGRDPAAVVTRVALVKLLATLPRAAAGQRVVAADTAVVVDGDMLGKAADHDDAARMLRRLRGRDHEAITGVAGIGQDGRLRTDVGRSRVRFTAFSDHELEVYLASDSWRGKAGAYGVQDAAARPLIATVEGSLSNVVGLPLELLFAILGAP